MRAFDDLVRHGKYNAGRESNHDFLTGSQTRHILYGGTGDHIDSQRA
ncbi:MAG: hypothetical protein SNJ58_14105 [Aggregatilineales bacterium]